MELKVNELRIGNLCNYGGQSHVIDYADIELLARKIDMEEVIEYEPIPLTEEWALKLGGKELPNGCVQFERFFIIPYDKGNNKWAVSHNGTNAHVTELHTVHELQNFFHCVGQELTTK
jgi:hypothetical protein